MSSREKKELELTIFLLPFLSLLPLQITNILKNNPALQKAADDMKASGVSVSNAVAEALRQVEESEFIRAVSLPLLSSSPSSPPLAHAFGFLFCSSTPPVKLFRLR